MTMNTHRYILLHPEQKKIKRDDKELKRIQSADRGPERIAEMQRRLDKKRVKTDKLFQVYLGEVFENCLTSYA
jgi:hypothetical protein